MASTSKSWIGSNSWVSCYLVVESTPNTAGNYSDVTATLYGARNDGKTSYNYDESNFWININGTQTHRTSGCTVSGSGWTQVHTQTTRVYHNDDGSKSITISAGGGITGTTFQMGSASVGLVLDKIARKSTMDVSDGVLGTAQGLTVKRQSTSYTHTITYACGDASGTICSKSSDTTIYWTPPVDLAWQNTNGTTLCVTLTIETFNGSTSIGTNSATIMCTIPEWITPSVSVSLEDVMGYLSKYGAYVQGKSVLSGTLSASGSYGSWITAYSTSVDGKTFAGSTFTANPITNSGTLTVSVTVTDSRGRKGYASAQISVLAYSSPSISSAIAKRCDADGSSNSGGEYLAVIFNSNITSLNNKNTTGYKVKYKKTSESSYTEVSLSNYEGTYAISGGTYIFSADKSSSYNIIVCAADYFSETTKSIIGGSVSKVFSILAKGLGFAFGKVAEIENALEIAWDTYCKKNLYVGDGLKMYSDNTYGYVDTPNRSLKINGKTLLDTTYPVGSICIRYDHTSPASLFGGTWTRITGAFLWATNGTIGLTGGESTHTLTIDEMPSHRHSHSYGNIVAYGSGYGNNINLQLGSQGFHAMDINTHYNGGGGAHNNMPPYIQVSVWRRTA